MANKKKDMGGIQYHISFKALFKVYSGNHKFAKIQVLKGRGTRFGGGGGVFLVFAVGIVSSPHNETNMQFQWIDE